MPPFTDAELKTEISTKIARLQEFMERKQCTGILLTQVRNFEWLTGGVGDNQVGRASEIGAASLLLTKDGRKFVIAAHSEIPRLMEDGLGGLGYEPVELKWYEKPPDLAKLLGISGTLGSDVQREGCTTVNIAPLRYQLSPAEILKYRWLGRDCAEAVEHVTRQVAPGMTERKIEADISNALMQRGVRPTVLLIGADDRILRFRHALPSDRAVEKYAMVNICGEKMGLDRIRDSVCALRSARCRTKEAIARSCRRERQVRARVAGRCESLGHVSASDAVVCGTRLSRRVEVSSSGRRDRIQRAGIRDYS